MKVTRYTHQLYALRYPKYALVVLLIIGATLALTHINHSAPIRISTVKNSSDSHISKPKPISNNNVPVQASPTHTASTSTSSTQPASSSSVSQNQPTQSSSISTPIHSSQCDQTNKQNYENKYNTAYAQEDARHQQEITNIANSYSARGAYNSSYREAADAAENQTHDSNDASLLNTLNSELSAANCT